jgi:hypothetical protein
VSKISESQPRAGFFIMMNFNSPEWHVMRRWAEEQLRKCRDKNDAVNLSDTETALLRGEIRFIKRFLDLPNEATRGVVVEPDE